ncbi:MAG: methylmalonyl Co-A mutase-associated GTPase MeaB [Kiloniellales bacterium]|nr:methylmalonyl Co-A mutase-associated GTPase MeaB [Kiloniellales bacterium]MDJ0968844.1 methylmalonyl Co-A mutase-associated GTPase MeaB [Kiloniellales bacterium]MDJ0981908.1 methylmalonyl Co-A mutase-associated GTPase MeaB [Kiloniellales bacterium]
MSTAKRARKPAVKTESLAEGVLAGDRRALARAITLIESTRADHRREAATLLEALLPRTGRSIRLGISGVPGVGKSTFIEAFGLKLIEAGHRVAVLAVDPSSQRSGGSILGDKTRMPELATAEAAFIRPSPTRGTLGGVARRTREAMLATEAAGFDVVIVETVGVGQSETAVAEMVDLFLLLIAPGGGDELQGIKRGIMEIADLIVVNKADGKLKDEAGRTAAEYQSALQLLRPRSQNWTPRVLLCSALSGTGVPEVWEAVGAYRAALEPEGEIAARRSEQARQWLWQEVQEGLMAALQADPAVEAAAAKLEAKVVAGKLPATAAAQELLKAFLER